MSSLETSNKLTTNNQLTRLAILDLGTNTFHLLVADIIAEGKPKVVHQETIAVKLGERGISDGKISPEAFKRGVEALIAFKERIDQYQVKTVKTAATSAIRSASNGEDFIEKIKSETGLHLEVIDGEREAELIYLGVKAAIAITETSLIVDIGGGSVEFIICNRSKIYWKKSYPIGAARIMDKFHKSDPIADEEIIQLKTYLNNTLTDLQEQLNLYRPALMIGSAGSFESFAEMEHPEFKASFESPEKQIDIKRFQDISDWIIKSSHAERKQMTQITPVRVDMIVVAAIMINYILGMSTFKLLKLSSYSLKEGLLFEMLE